MSSILYILITTRFAFLIQIQRCYSHWNRVRIEADIPWILKINKIHQKIPHLEYFPKREGHPKCNVAIHPIPPPNGCRKGGIMNYQYTRPQISYFWTENQCQMHPTARSAEINDIFIYRTNCICRTHYPQVFLEQSWIDIHIVIDYKNDHDDWLQNQPI